MSHTYDITVSYDGKNWGYSTDPLKVGHKHSTINFNRADGQTWTFKNIWVWRDGDQVPSCAQVSSQSYCVAPFSVQSQSDAQIELDDDNHGAHKHTFYYKICIEPGDGAAPVCNDPEIINKPTK